MILSFRLRFPQMPLSIPGDLVKAESTTRVDCDVGTTPLVERYVNGRLGSNDSNHRLA
jgi:hypothetical protein